MAPTIGSAWRSFWHTMTSNDRHASHDSPYRTGQHVAIPQSRHAPLTSVTTEAVESRTDLHTTATNESTDTASSYFSKVPNAHTSTSPYSPGMRSTMQRTQSNESRSATVQAAQTGEIQMQNFSDGLPPPPPVGHSWQRIERWTEDNYEELYDNISEGCTQNDINELEHELDCTLPMEVRESLQCHDGQERGGLPTGIIFGCMLLDCEEIVQEWKNWRTVSEEFLTEKPSTIEMPIKAFDGGASSSSKPTPAPVQTSSNWREELLARQDSQPSNAVQKAYALPSWIPLARDWGGNCLAVDLAPGPAGKWGQVILMGRDYDCKYVVSRSWAAFLATVADDMGTSKVFVNEDTGELKLREFRGVEPAYLDILRWRTDQKYGRKPPRKRPNGAGPAGPNANRASPYASPVEAERRRSSPQRFSGTSSMAAPSPRGSVSSPLARVAEEMPPPVKTQIDRKDSFPRSEKLISPLASTPTLQNPLNGALNDRNMENVRPAPPNNNGAAAAGLGVKNAQVQEDAAGDMKTVEI